MVADVTPAGHRPDPWLEGTRAVDVQTFMDVVQLHAEYASAVDSGHWERWIECFVEQCDYRIQPRENHERGFPLATLALLSKDMLRDRAYGITETLYHDPYYQRHVVGMPLVGEDAQGCLRAQAHYAVFRTKLSGESTVFNVGRYLDRIRREDGRLRLVSRLCVYDSEMIPNSLIYPI